MDAKTAAKIVAHDKLVAALKVCGTLVIHYEKHGDDVCYGITTAGSDRLRRTAHGTSLHTAALEMWGDRQMKPCTGCEQVKSLTAFGEGGMNSVCKECENQRGRRNYEDKRARATDAERNSPDALEQPPDRHGSSSQSGTQCH